MGSRDDWSDFLGDTTPLRPQPAPAAPDNVVSLDDSRTRAYVTAALDRETAQLSAMGKDSGRNAQLNVAALKLGQLPADRAVVRERLLEACANNGLLSEDGAQQCEATINSGFAKADREGRRAIPDRPKNGKAVTEVQSADLEKSKHAFGRTLRRTVAADIEIATPEWAWECNGRGRIQKGTLSIFAGRPGAGKSSAARWFAAKATLGKLHGCFDGQKINVAYIAGEEPWEYVIAPGLAAAGADMRRVFTYDALDPDGRRTRLLSNVDEEMLTEQFLADDIKWVIVDPLMSTISSVADVHRNNEVRDYIEPWSRIAQRIDGVVSGIAHLRKNTSGDAVSLITGSSAFGEVARSVFAFVKDSDSDEGERVMSQAKNSTGHEDLALTYRIDPMPVTASDGTVADVGRFVITGDSDVTAEQVLAAAGSSEYGEGAACRRWLREHLEEQGRAQSKDVLRAARDAGGWNDRMVYRQQKKLRVVIESTGTFPRSTWWSLPLH